MPKTSAKKLAYMAEYQKSPENVEKRVDRNRARRQAIAAGAVKKGDGKEIDHKKMLALGGSDKASNTRVVPATENRGWRSKHPEAYGRKK